VPGLPLPALPDAFSEAVSAVERKDVHAARAIPSAVPCKSGIPRVYGEPVSSSSYVIGHSQSGSFYVSPFTVSVSGTTWYLINFNHRQAFVPSSEVKLL
jgi:hypothetical protein